MFEKLLKKNKSEAPLHEYNTLVKAVASMKHTIDILTSSTYSESGRYRGNLYNTYSSIVTELSNKYSGKADWGNQLVQNIISVRAAFTIGNGIKITAVKTDNSDGEREKEWVDNLLTHNSLSPLKQVQLATEAEIEGKVLFRLKPYVDEDMNENITVNFLPWATTRYKVTTKGNFYDKYSMVVIKRNGENDEVLKDDEFVYQRFTGRITDINEPTPKVGLVLKLLEDIDKALWDWREMNHLFGAPTPFFKVENKSDVKPLQAALSEIQWRIGKLLITNADFSMVEITGAGAESIRKEIETKAKISSGMVGVPVHFLGFVDLMSNRATADNLMELLFASTSMERNSWVGLYSSMIEKAMRMHNEQMQNNLDSRALKVDIPEVSYQKLKELQEVWLPMYVGGGISLPTFLSKVPDVDVGAEIDRLSGVDLSHSME